MTEREKALADQLLSRIETASRECHKREAYSTLIAEILEAANGLRTLIGIPGGDESMEASVLPVD